GPSLGRKRPRRAAVTRGATAPQQYAAALHKVQVFLYFDGNRPDQTNPNHPQIGAANLSSDIKYLLDRSAIYTPIPSTELIFSRIRDGRAHRKFTPSRRPVRWAKT